MSCSSCAGTTPTGGSVIGTMVECASQGQDILSRIEAEAIKLGAIAFGGDIDKWNKIEVAAINDGLVVGGCAVAQVVNDWITKKSLVGSANVADVHDAKKMFEDYRAKFAGNSTFRTKVGDL